MACLSCQGGEELLPVSEPRSGVSEIPGYILSGFEFGAQIVELFRAFRAPGKKKKKTGSEAGGNRLEPPGPIILQMGHNKK